MGGGAKAIVGAATGFFLSGGNPMGALAGFSAGSTLDAADQAKKMASAQNSANQQNLAMQQQALDQQKKDAETSTQQMSKTFEAMERANQNQINQQNAAMALYQNQMSSLMNAQAAANQKEPEILSQPGTGAGGRRGGIQSPGGGAGGTMLTGPMGVDPSQLTLGRTTLLGG
jgi:hypothetical protein